MSRLRENTRTSAELCEGCKNTLTQDEEYYNINNRSGMKPLCNKCLEIKRAEYRKEHIRELMQSSNVAPKYLSASEDNLKIDKYKKIVSAYDDKGLFLWGDFGSGKTYVAICILRRLLLAGNDVKFCSVPELLLEIKNTFGADSQWSEKDIIDKYSNYPYLLLDDMGAEKCSPWSLQVLYLIIDRRDRFMRPTIITSNLSLDEIKNKLSDRISSRICGMCEIIKLNEKDLRLKFKGVK